MDMDAIAFHTKNMVESGHRVFQIHRFAEGEQAHVARLELWSDFPSGAHVIDMGSGTGEVARLMNELRDDLQFTLVNISEAQLAYSPAHMQQYCADFTNLPVSDGSYDGTMFCFSIGHSDAMKALKEATRIVRNGGVVFIYDMIRISGSNESMREVDYQVGSRFDMESAAKDCGLKLDFYMEPQDSGNYGNAVLGEEFSNVFAGTIPAIWRFIKC